MHRWGSVAATELMPRLVGGDTETVCSKLKRGNRFLKPNFELGPKLGWLSAGLYRDLLLLAASCL
jgi:hypothetical protein